MRRLIAVVTVLLAGMLVLAGCSSTGASGGDSTPPAPTSTATADLPTGTVGAAHLSDGYLELGTGPTTLAEYFDPLCPYCGEFEKTNGTEIQQLVATNAITVRLYPLTFLDRSSQGTQYSSRASSALTCVAASRPASTLDFLGELYANQPKENSTGLTDDRLIALAAKAGADDVGPCISNGKYAAWAQTVTNTALTQKIPALGKPLEGTPTIIIGKTPYAGSITDQQAFAEAVTKATK